MSTAVSSTSELCAAVTSRLSGEFGALPRYRVERCVGDVCACARHLGFDVTPTLVEKVARERLLAMVKSEPPSGRIRH